ATGNRLFQATGNRLFQATGNRLFQATGNRLFQRICRSCRLDQHTASSSSPWGVSTLHKDLRHDELAARLLQGHAQADLRVLGLEKIGPVLGTVHEVRVGLPHRLRHGIEVDVVVQGDVLAGHLILYVVAVEDVEDHAAAGDVVGEVVAGDHILATSLGDGVERGVEVQRSGAHLSPLGVD